MGIRSGVSADTPDRIVIDAGAVYINYGLTDERLLGATRGGNEFNLNRVVKNIEVDGPKGGVKGMKRVTEVNPQITANLIELSVENLIAAIAGGNQSDTGYIGSEYAGVGDGAVVLFELNQDDLVKDTERVYLSNASGVMTLKTRSVEYSSRFIGDNAEDNKGFVTGVGDWDKGHNDDTIELAASGQSGLCLKYTGSISSVVGFLTLTGSTILTNLVVGEHYRLQIAMKKGAVWGGGNVTIACDAGSKAITTTTGWVMTVIEFIAVATDAEITLTAANAPVAADSFYIDSLELEKVNGDYVMNIAEGEVIFPEGDVPTADEKIVVSYNYALAAAGTHTSITGGEIADADYITNVAIVGNVSGKTHPVICIIDNVLADAGFSLALAPRDEAVPTIVFTGHYATGDLDTEPWEVRWPNS